MKNKMKIIMCAAALTMYLTACGSGAAAQETVTTMDTATSTDAGQIEDSAAPVEEGTYTADFDTDSGMFHVNEANNGKGVLTVKDGKMTIHVSLASKKIEHLFYGSAQDAQKEGAALIDPTTDTVTYSDGACDEVYGFDIPVPAIDTEFNVALIGTHGNWYDHKVTVSNLEKTE